MLQRCKALWGQALRLGAIYTYPDQRSKEVWIGTREGDTIKMERFREAPTTVRLTVYLYSHGPQSVMRWEVHSNGRAQRFGVKPDFSGPDPTMRILQNSMPMPRVHGMFGIFDGQKLASITITAAYIPNDGRMCGRVYLADPTRSNPLLVGRGEPYLHLESFWAMGPQDLDPLFVECDEPVIRVTRKPTLEILRIPRTEWTGHDGPMELVYCRRHLNRVRPLSDREIRTGCNLSKSLRPG
jgi:hypothetical protein